MAQQKLPLKDILAAIDMGAKQYGTNLPMMKENKYLFGY